MRIDFLGLHAFVAIAERGSFQLAAAHLNLSQTALSHRMRKLEDDLGVRLLQRTTREVSLTPAGVTLLPKARGMIDELQASLDALRQGGRARQERLSIGCLPTVAAGLLPQALARFRQRRPEVAVRVHDITAADIGALVDAGAVAFGVTVMTSHRWDFYIQPLAKDPFVLVGREDALPGAGGIVNWSELADAPLVRISPQTGNGMVIDDALGSRRESLRWRYEVQHVNTAIALVRAGLGLTIAPRLALAAEDMRGLSARELRNPKVGRRLGLVWKRSAPLGPLAEELRALIVEAFGPDGAAPSRDRRDKAFAAPARAQQEGDGEGRMA